MEPQPPPQHHQHAPPPFQNPNPNFQHHQQYYYPNPNPNPEDTAAAAAVVSYGPHGGSVVDHTATAGADAAPYYYYHGYGWDPSKYYGVNPNSYGQVPQVPSRGLNSTVPPPTIPSQAGAKSNYRRRSKEGFRTTKVAQAVHCEVCKIECNTQDVLNLHKQGKKHKKNLQKLQESITPKSQRAQMMTNGAEAAATKILGRARCEVCDIYCDTEAVLNIHEQGKKHKKKFQRLQCSITPKPQKDGMTANGKENEEPEPNKLVQQAHCGTCNIFCNTQEVLNVHNLGKKHKRALWNLHNPITPNPQSAHLTTNDAENKDALVSEQDKALGNEGRKRREVTEEDLETKKRKILGGGAAPGEVKVCTICNVVVNSQIVYNAHIAGSKHALMAKKQQEAALVECKTSADSENLVAASADSENLVAASAESENLVAENLVAPISALNG